MIPEHGDSHVYDIVIDCIIGVGILVNVYLILDQMTDGELSRSVSLRMTKWRARMATSINREHTFRREMPHVLFDAMTIVEDRNAE